VAFTQAQIEAFEQQLVDRQGVQSVTFADQQMTFASYAEAKDFLAVMRRQVSGSTTRYAATSKGV